MMRFVPRCCLMAFAGGMIFSISSAAQCEYVSGALIVRANQTCEIATDHPSVMAELRMEDSSTLVLSGVANNLWRIHIREASFGQNTRWLLRGLPATSIGKDAERATPTEATGESLKDDSSSVVFAGRCEDGRSGSDGGTGKTGGQGIGLDLIIGVKSLVEWRIDGSGGVGGKGENGEKGEKGGDGHVSEGPPPKYCNPGNGGDGGDGGEGGRGGPTSQIRIRYYWTPSVWADKLSKTATFEESDRALSVAPRLEHAIRIGLHFDSKGGAGGAGGEAGRGGGAGKQKCKTVLGTKICTKSADPGGNGRGGRVGPQGELRAPFVELIDPPTELRLYPNYVDPSTEQE